MLVRNFMFCTVWDGAFVRHFPSCFKPHRDSEVSCIVFVTKISFHSNANKINFHMKSFAICLTFVMLFKASRNLPIN